MADSKTTTASSTPAGIELSRALTFFFDDPNWVPKLLVGSVCALLTPVLIGWVFLTGYAVAIAKRVMQQQDPPAPEWDDINTLFMDGIRGAAIWFAHKLPVIVLGCFLVLALIGGALLQSNDGPAPEAFLYFGAPVLFAGWLLVFVLGLALLIYVPAAFVRFVRTDRLGAAFDVMENLTYIRDQSTPYLTGLLAILVAGFIGQLGFMVFCIGVFPGIFWATTVSGYVVGELARLDGGAHPTDPS